MIKRNLHQAGQCPQETVVDFLYKIIMGLCIICISAQVIITTYAVIGRFVIGKTAPWTDEMARLFMVWMSLMSASLAVKDNTHVRMTFFDKWIGAKGIKIRDFIFSLVNLAFCSVLFWKGAELIGQTHKTKLPGSSLPSSILYGAACVGGLFLIIMLLYRLGVLLCQRKQ